MQRFKRCSIFLIISNGFRGTEQSRRATCQRRREEESERNPRRRLKKRQCDLKWSVSPTLKGIEDEIHRAGIMRHNLDTNLKNEAENSKLNMAKIQHTWRKIMRDSKVQQLKYELEIMSPNHEREVDIKDAIIQLIDRDLDETEDQYLTALRSHIHNMD